MSSGAANFRTEGFLQEVVNRLRALSFKEIAKWPEYPDKPDINLHVPAELADYTFTLMKDTLPDGDIRIGIQCYRHGFLGTGRMTVDGFVVSSDGKMRSLSDQDVWDLT